MQAGLKIGILGSRGIPNAYGGFEQFAQYLAVGLIKKGHNVWVYNSHKHPYQEKEWNGIQIIHCKDLEHKIGTAGQFIYDYNCITDARKREFDILLQLGYTSNSIWYWKWPMNSINIVNMDGLEWKRSKYKKLTRRFLKYAEYLAAKNAHHLVADSIGIQKYLREEYGKDSTFIAYGADLFESTDTSVLENYDLKPKQYLLLIARMEPENNIETVIKGFIATPQIYPLIIIGGFQNKYGQELFKKYDGEKIKFTGAIYDLNALNILRYNSALYFHGHSVGGTNPSLLEAMACRCNIAAHENIFNKAILTDSAYYFSTSGEVKNIINLERDETIIQQRAEANATKIKTLYNWDKIIELYEQLFLEMTLIHMDLEHPI